MTEGVDITEQFETHHVTDKAEKLLSKFFVRNAALPRNYNFTFKENGFYRTLKRRVADQVADVDKSPLKISNMISDLMLGLVFASAILAIKDDNIFLAFLSGQFLHCLFVIAHNYFHQKDNWRMFCFNLTLLNYREWRVSHAMSHHLYTNSYYDMEISMFEPFLQWIPRPKTKTQRVLSVIFSPIVWTVMIAATAIIRLVRRKSQSSSSNQAFFQGRSGTSANMKASDLITLYHFHCRWPCFTLESLKRSWF